MDHMKALFLMSAVQLEAIRASTSELGMDNINCEIVERVAGKIVSAKGSVHDVMRLIGAVADHGEGTLYQATLI